MYFYTDRIDECEIHKARWVRLEYTDIDMDVL